MNDTDKAARLLDAHARERAIRERKSRRANRLRAQRAEHRRRTRERTAASDASPERSEPRPTKGACYGITPLESRHAGAGRILGADRIGPRSWGDRPFAVALDWYETGGLIDWPPGLGLDGDRHRTLEPLREAAGRNREPEPLALDGVTWWVKSRGTSGGDRDSYCRYWLTAGPRGCLVVQLNARRCVDRRLYNYRMTVPGDACLLLGVEHCVGLAHELVRFLGGRVADEWVKRADLCVDAPGADLERAAAKPYREGCVLGTAKRSECLTRIDCDDESDVRRESPAGSDDEPLVGRLRDLRGQTTGVGFGSRNWCSLTIYEKRVQTAGKSEEVQDAMQRERWGGRLPDKAVRVEWSVRHAWLTEWGIGDAEAFWGNLSNLGAKLWGLPPYDRYRFVRLVDDPAHAAHGNHHRARDSWFWEDVGDALLNWDGRPGEPLSKLQRDAITPERACKVLTSYAANIAAACGYRVHDLAGVLGLLGAVLPRCGVTNDYLAERWEAHADRRGLLEGEAVDLQSLGLVDAADVLRDALEAIAPAERSLRESAERENYAAAFPDDWAAGQNLPPALDGGEF